MSHKEDIGKMGDKLNVDESLANALHEIHELGDAHATHFKNIEGVDFSRFKDFIKEMKLGNDETAVTILREIEENQPAVLSGFPKFIIKARTKRLNVELVSIINQTKEEHFPNARVRIQRNWRAIHFDPVFPMERANQFSPFVVSVLKSLHVKSKKQPPYLDITLHNHTQRVYKHMTESEVQKAIITLTDIFRK